MNIRSITAGELEMFAAFSADAEANRDLRDYVARQWESGFSRPEWCFMQVGEGLPQMRAMYWSLPNAASPSDIARLELDWEGDYGGQGAEFVSATLDRAREIGSDKIAYLVETPPASYPERRAELMATLGFSVMRDGLRWEWTYTDVPVQVPDRLTFRNLEEVGEGAFVDAIWRVSEGTRDSWIQSMIAESEAAAAALEMFSDAMSLEHKPEWWLLGYDSMGELVGLVMMCRNNYWPIVDYIGVVPQKRGQGYANDLLAKGTAVMQAEGAVRAERIRGDTDKGNPAMSQAFRRAGYEQFRTRIDYQIRL